MLIHAATGGVGMAALQVAQRGGAEIFATAGSAAKRDWLRAHGITHVMDSRSLAFVDEIREATGGRGVDVVLSAQTGDGARASLGALASGGRFIELGKSGWATPEAVATLRPDVRFHAFDLSEAFAESPEAMHHHLRTIVDACGAGVYVPLPYASTAADQAAAAFQAMRQARHMGKLLITFRDDAAAGAAGAVLADATYAVTGAYGGLGALVVQWLIDKGARYLLLMGRGAPSPEVTERLAEARARGVRIEARQGDVSNPVDVRAWLAAAGAMPPLRGVLHAAGVVDDRMLVQQDWARFERVFAAKVEGSWNLHLETRETPLDFFVLLLDSDGAARLGGTEQPRRGERVHGCAGELPPRARTAGAQHQLGSVVRGRRGSHARRECPPCEPGLPCDHADRWSGGARRVAAMPRDAAPSQIGVMPMDWPTYFDSRRAAM